MAYNTTLTAPVVAGSHDKFAAVIVCNGVRNDLPVGAYDGPNAILNGGGNCRAYANNSKAIRLPVEIVSFVTGASPQIEFWVSYLAGSPMVSAAELCIEADTIQTTQPAFTHEFGRNAVWNLVYKAVLHLNNTDYIDSTGNGHDGTLSGTTGGVVTTGHPWGGNWIDFTKSGYLTLANSNSLVDSSQHTLQAIVNLDVSVDTDGIIGSRENVTDDDWSQLQANGKVFVKAGTEVSANPSTDTPTAATHWIALVQEASTLRARRDGVDVGSTGGTSGTTITGGNPFRIGTYYDDSAGRMANGRIGGVRISKTAFSSDWHSTEKDNQSATIAWFTNDGWADSGGGTIHDTEASHSVINALSTSLNLSQTHALLGQHSVTVSASTAAAVQQVHALAGLSSSVAVKSSLGVLASGLMLAAASSEAAAATTQAALVQVHQLLGADSRSDSQSLAAALAQVQMLEGRHSELSSLSTAGPLSSPPLLLRFEQCVALAASCVGTAGRFPTNGSIASTRESPIGDRMTVAGSVIGWKSRPTKGNRSSR